MKFFDKITGLNTNSLFDFMSSLLCMFVLAPVRLVHEIAKKAVYLTRKQLDKVFFTAMCFAIGLTVVTVFIRYSRKQYSLFLGKLPVIVLITGDLILFCMYALFNSTKFVVYDSSIKQLVKPATHTEDRRDADSTHDSDVQQTANKSNTSDDSNSTDFTAVQMVDITEHDLREMESTDNNEEMESDFSTIIDSQELREYQTKLLNGVMGLQKLQDDVAKISTEELQQLQQNLAEIRPPSKFVDSANMKRIAGANNLEDLDDSDLQDVQDIPADFKLCL